MKIVTSFDITSNTPVKTEGYISQELALILQAVCNTNEVSVYDVKGKRRWKKLADARREYCYWACKLTQLTERDPNGNSLTTIGAVINIKHATVLHHKKTIIQWLGIPGYRLQAKFEMIEDKLKL